LKINVKGLKFQNWLYLMGFSVIILAVLWALQFLFLGSFFQNMKLTETRRIGNTIADNFGAEDFGEIVSRNAFENNLRIILIDQAGHMAGNFDGFPTDEPGMRPIGSIGMFPHNDFAVVKQQLADAGTDRIAYLNTNGRASMSLAVFVARVFDGDGAAFYLYISNPIPPIDSTLSVLRTQFFIISVILLILSLIVAQWISQKMSKPIIRLTKSAERLVKGNLDADVYDDGYTEIQQLAAALNYATGELRSLDGYRREFIANVSHDLKTPLTIVKFYGELIRDVSGDDPSKRAEHCDTIIREADRLTGMVGEILELSRLESGSANATMEAVDISTTLTDSLSSFRALAQKQGYTFHTDIEPNLVVTGSEPMLRRALYNLISNAVNFTGADKRVNISLKAVGQNVRFEVADTGEGIPPQEQDAIWDRYYKSAQPHKRAIVGTGLGLSIVKNLLTAHGARFGVHSAPGQGCVFWFELKKQ